MKRLRNYLKENIDYIIFFIYFLGMLVVLFFIAWVIAELFVVLVGEQTGIEAELLL